MFRKKPKFYKRISVLLVLVLFSLAIVFSSGPALAQEVNYSLDGAPEFQKIYIWEQAHPSGSSTWYDTVANMNDNNESSYVGGNGLTYDGWPGWITVRYNAIVTFAEMTDINRVEYVHSGSNFGLAGYHPSYSKYIRTYLYYGGGWNLIDDRDAFMSKTTVSITAGTPWPDVTKVKIELFMNWQSFYPVSRVTSKLYEIRAFGPAAPAAPVYQDIGLRVQASSGTVSIAAEIGVPTSPLRIAKNGVIYGIVLVDPSDSCASNIRIRTSSETKALAIYNCYRGYSLDSLARKYSDFGDVPWYPLIEDSRVIGAADKTDITYSTTLGSWLPVDTNIDTGSLRLNVNGERDQGGYDPRTGYQVKYRVWGDTEVRVKTKAWGETHSGIPFHWSQENYFQVRMDRVDTIQRQSNTSILINGVPQTINIGDSYQIESVNWYPGGNGWAYSQLNVINVSSTFFDIHQEVWEYDEEYDSAHVRIESYIELAP